MRKLEFFEAPVCCSSGCNSPAGAERARIAALEEKLKQAEVAVTHYDLSADPKAFMENEAVSNLLNQRGLDALPVTVLDGGLVQSGYYPTDGEFHRLLGVPLDTAAQAAKVKDSSCECGTKGCCS